MARARVALRRASLASLRVRNRIFPVYWHRCRGLVRRFRGGRLRVFMPAVHYRSGVWGPAVPRGQPSAEFAVEVYCGFEPKCSCR